MWILNYCNATKAKREIYWIFKFLLLDNSLVFEQHFNFYKKLGASKKINFHYELRYFDSNIIFYKYFELGITYTSSHACVYSVADAVMF